MILLLLAIQQDVTDWCFICSSNLSIPAHHSSVVSQMISHCIHIRSSYTWYLQEMMWFFVTHAKLHRHMNDHFSVHETTINDITDVHECSGCANLASIVLSRCFPWHTLWGQRGDLIYMHWCMLYLWYLYTTNWYSSWQCTVPKNLQSFPTRSVNWRSCCAINQPCTCSRLTVLWILVHLLHRMPWSLFPDHSPVFRQPISYHLLPQTTYSRLHMSNQQQPWNESEELKNPRTFIRLGYHSRWATSPLMAPWKGPHFQRKESSWVS